MKSKEKLSFKAPPIVEVVCGFGFEPIPSLDPVAIGAYWSDRKSDFPGRKVLPLISDSPSFVLGGVTPLRTWLISSDDVYVVQIQPDRFYMNWRKRNEEYPRFSDHDDQIGLLSRTLGEFEKFGDFCDSEFRLRPVPKWLELSKTDHLVQGLHWRDLDDLGVLLPCTADFTAFSSTKNASLSLRFSEKLSPGILTVALEMGSVIIKNEPFRIMKFEKRVRTESISSTDLEKKFLENNEHLNLVFSKLIPKDERDRRFQ